MGRRKLCGNRRGVSQVVGAVLLIGVVLLASITVLVLGAPGIEDVQTERDDRQASIVMQELDSELSSLSTSGDDPSVELDFSATNPTDFALVREGYVTLTVDGRPECSAQVNLSSIRYRENGRTVAYEAGGVWRGYRSGASRMVTAPSLTYRKGTVHLHVVNLTGNVDQSTTRARLLSARSQARTVAVRRQLVHGDCVRPDSLSLRIRSDFYRGWADYVEAEFGVDATAHDHNRTVTAVLDQDDLPERVDDSRNDVVNLTSDEYNTVTFGTDEITVDKGADNAYTVSVTPLQRGRIPIGNVTSVEADSAVPRQPLDVMFVLDESGSMNNDDDGDGETRSEDAQTAARSFVADLNASKDRAGVVSYDTSSEYRRTDDDEYISSNFGPAGEWAHAGVNGSINDIPDVPGGGTESQDGMRKAHNVFSLQSNQSRKKVMILLTDGVNDDCQGGPGDDDINDDDPTDCGGPDTDNKQSLAIARDAAARGVSIYTVGYGDEDDLDEAFLEEVARVGGGEYHRADDAEELEDVFEEIRRSVSQTKVIAKAPVSSNFTAAGAVQPPQVPGSDDQVARFAVNGHNFSNINDPSTGSQYSHSFAVDGGESVTMAAYDYECDGGDWADTGITRNFDGDTYRVARCTDVVATETLTPTAIYNNSNDDFTPFVTTNYDDVWQDNVTEAFQDYEDVSINKTGSTFELELKSNQALVYYDLPDGPHSENRLFLLYEIGIAESDADAAGAVNVEVSTVALEE